MDPGEAARRLAAEYVATGGVSAVVIAGSLGRGRADRFSDVEVDVYWRSAPADAQRQAPTLALGGTVKTLWPYDEDDAEWSEDVRVGGVDVTVSGFACAEMERWIDELPVASEPWLVRQMRLSAIHDGEVVHGDQLVERWRTASVYPRPLAVATASGYLVPERLNRWRLWRALLERSDLVMLHRASSDVVEAILGALCAVNRAYIEHPSFKWSRHLVERFDRAPAGFADRLFDALDAGVVEGAPRLHELLTETLTIVRSELPEVDLRGVEAELASRVAPRSG